MAVASPGGITSLDPVNDLHLKGVDVVEASMRLRVLQDSLREFNCIHSPTFDMQVRAFVCVWGCVEPLSERAHKTLKLFIRSETVQLYENVPRASFSCAAIAYLCAN